MSIERLQAFYNETFSVTPSSVGYEEWIETVELPSLHGNEEVSLMLASMTHPPVISIVIPVYNPAEIYLRACLDSVPAQSYPHWELCIADDRSPKNMCNAYCANTRPRIAESKLSTESTMVIFRLLPTVLSKLQRGFRSSVGS